MKNPRLILFKHLQTSGLGNQLKLRCLSAYFKNLSVKLKVMEDKSLLRPSFSLAKKQLFTKPKLEKKRIGLDQVRIRHRKSITAGLALGFEELEFVGMKMLQAKVPRKPLTLSKTDFASTPKRQLQTAYSKRSKITLNDSQDLSFTNHLTMSPKNAWADSSFDLLTRDTKTFLTTHSRCNLQIPKVSNQLNDSTDSVKKLNQLIKDCDQISRKKQLLNRKVSRFQKNSKTRLKKIKSQDQGSIFKQGYIRASINSFKRDKAAFIFGKDGKGRFFDQHMRDPLRAKSISKINS